MKLVKLRGVKIDISWFPETKTTELNPSLKEIWKLYGYSEVVSDQYSLQSSSHVHGTIQTFHNSATIFMIDQSYKSKM